MWSTWPQVVRCAAQSHQGTRQLFSLDCCRVGSCLSALLSASSLTGEVSSSASSPRSSRTWAAA
eukprot:3894420-Pyramimonas_sp.AAC.1